MTDDRLRTAPAERFAAHYLVFDLKREAAALETKHTTNKHGHQQKTLYKHASHSVALFVLDAGATLPEHAAAGTVTVQAIEGDLELTVINQPNQLTPGMTLVMVPGVRHSVRSDTRAVFLLQVSLEARG